MASKNQIAHSPLLFCFSVRVLYMTFERKNFFTLNLQVHGVDGSICSITNRINHRDDQTRVWFFTPVCQNPLQDTYNFHLPVKMESLFPILQRLVIGRHRSIGAHHWPVQYLQFFCTVIGREIETDRGFPLLRSLNPSPNRRGSWPEVSNKCTVNIFWSLPNHPLRTKKSSWALAIRKKW